MNDRRTKATRVRKFIVMNVELCFLALCLAFSDPASAQTPTSEPGAWRAVAYADLQHPIPEIMTYTDLWRDALDENNRVYARRGDNRFRIGNAPATEAHFVIWSARKSVVVSELDTATACTLKEIRSASRATIKMCPMRVAIYEGALVQTLDAGRGCYLELAPAAAGEVQDGARSAAYAAYDPSTRTVTTGLVVDHRAIEGCSRRIPLPN